MSTPFASFYCLPGTTIAARSGVVKENSVKTCVGLVLRLTTAVSSVFVHSTREQHVTKAITPIHHELCELLPSLHSLLSPIVNPETLALDSLAVSAGTSRSVSRLRIDKVWERDNHGSARRADSPRLASP